jgi:hypothetical protein
MRIHIQYVNHLVPVAIATADELVLTRETRLHLWCCWCHKHGRTRTITHLRLRCRMGVRGQHHPHKYDDDGHHGGNDGGIGVGNGRPRMPDGVWRRWGRRSRRQRSGLYITNVQTAASCQITSVHTACWHPIIWYIT